MSPSTPQAHQTRPLRWSVNLFLAFCLLLLPSLTFMTGEVAQAGPQAGCTPDESNLAIHEIQGAGHLSSYDGDCIGNVTGIVTARTGTGFYMQEPDADIDGDVKTSEGIFVYTGGAPSVNIGDSVSVTGFIDEYRPGGLSTGNLTITEFTSSPQVNVGSTTTLPTPTIIGAGGRLPPDTVIEDDAGGNVETGGTFDPATDGIDFYESLEGMLVEIQQPLAVSPTSGFGEIAVVGDAGAHASALSSRDSLVISSGDFNPERILLDDTIVTSEPQVKTGALFSSSIVGVLDYTFGNFKLFNTEALPSTTGGVSQETASTVTDPDTLSVASFNLENLEPGDPQAKFDELAAQIVDHLKSPDLLGLQEIQDNNGATNNGVVAADQTYQKLIDAISTAGGPTYQYRDIAPVNNQDGGEPGGNIRVGFLFRTDRGLSFTDRAGGTATNSVAVVSGPSGPELSYSPGRIDPTNSAFTDSRKPLAAEFQFNGDTLFVVVNHFNSKGGDDPLFGFAQPPVFSSETQRVAQAQVVNGFVDDLLALDASAHIIVLGDLNDFQFSAPLTTLKGGVLTDLIDTLPAAERYTYIYDGNAEALDHILVSDELADNVTYEFDVVHLNAEFPDVDRVTDHDPPLARFQLAPPDLMLDKTVNLFQEPPHPGDALTYTLTLTNNGSIEAQGVHLTDTLPSEVVGNDLDVTVDVPAGGQVVKTIDATVAGDTPPDTLVTNTAYFTHSSGNGMDSISFTTASEEPGPGGVEIYLPVLIK